jgi:hypothetical protein
MRDFDNLQLACPGRMGRNRASITRNPSLSASASAAVLTASTCIQEIDIRAYISGINQCRASELWSVVRVMSHSQADSACMLHAGGHLHVSVAPVLAALDEERVHADGRDATVVCTHMHACTHAHRRT